MYERRSAIALCLALGAMLLAGTETKAGPKALDAKFQSELDVLRDKFGFPGATAAYILPDGRIGVAATGLADVEANTPMTPQTRMLPASIGKTFVAATALALVQEHVLRLDDPISKWLGDRPWFSRLPNANDITLWHLLTHSSGLPDHVHMDAYAHDAAKKWNEPGNPFPPESLVAYVLDQPALFKPGHGYSYTDTGYILVGLIIEKATGHTYYDEVTSRFLKPLHLTLTAPESSPNLPGLAAGYMAANNVFGLPPKTTIAPGVMAFNPVIEWTGGGLVSNSRDLVVWAKTLYEGRAMKGNYRKDLLRSVPTSAEDPDHRYGTGVYVERKGPFGPDYGHAGWIPGYRSDMRYYPKYRIAVAFQINTDIGLTDRTSTVLATMRERLTRIVVDAARRH